MNESPSGKPDFKAWAASLDATLALYHDETARNFKDASIWELMVWITRKVQDQEQEWVGSC